VAATLSGATARYRGGEFELAGHESSRFLHRDRTAQPIGQHGPDDRAAHARPHVGVFVEDPAVEVGAAQPARIVSPVNADAGAMGRDLDPQVALILVHDERGGEALQIRPGDVLGLREIGPDVGIAPSAQPVCGLSDAALGMMSLTQATVLPQRRCATMAAKRCVRLW